MDVDLERPVWPTPDVEEAEPDCPVSRKDRQSERRAVLRSRRALGVACLVTAGVPIALIISLWRNLTLPFWYNEQWRAYYISKPGDWWSALKTDGGPFPAGWYFLERGSASLFGSTELVMRIPVTVFLPITCVLLLLLARRWMSLVPAVIVALVGGLTGTLVSFAVQLSEYQIDAAAVVAILLLYEVAASREKSRWGDVPMWLAYGGIALACVFSTPAIFVAGPVLLLDVFRQARDRSPEPGRWERWPPARVRSRTSSSSLRRRTRSPRATTGIRTLRPITGSRTRSPSCGTASGDSSPARSWAPTTQTSPSC